MAEHILLGKRGEEIAVEYLQGKGFKIIEKSWHFKHKEVDIIAKINDTLIFIEVKSRTTAYWGNPEEFVSKQKQRFIIAAAENYVETRQFSGDVRFDIIAIIFDKNNYTLEYIENAFYP